MHGIRIITWFLLLLCSHLVFAKANHKFYNEPQWVNSKTANTNQVIPVDKVKGGRHYLLIDSQIQVSKTGKVAAYHHYAEHLVNQNGIENSSQISIDFDPAYQKVYVHKLHVWRKGKKIDKRFTARITLIQPERESKDLIYNGEQSLNIILEDIRVGDTIEYSYSRYGSNPVFDGTFDTVRNLQWTLPVGEIYQRIIWHKKEPLYFKRTNTDIEVKQVRRGGATEYIFKSKNVPALSIDNATPDWFSPFASVSFSETQNWKDVVKWGRNLFLHSTKGTSSIRELANKIKNDNNDQLQQIAAALQYVQANVRYLGLELGENSHRPTSAAVTLQRRYGDCKDKSALYISLLHELGITAYPVLVNTNDQHELKKRLPAYGAFNHVIVKVMYGDKHYWFDPTRQYQLGAAYDIYQPDYGYALVLKPGNNKLESMQQSKNAYNVVANEQFYVDATKRDKVRYEIKTNYYGLDSEYQRNRIASKGMQKIQKGYLDFYKSYYPGIKNVTAAVFDDTSENGALIGNEKYVVPDFWRQDKESNIFYADFYSSSISSYLKQPTLKSRKYPYNLSYPVSIVQNITVNFANDSWSFKKDSFSEDNDFFHYKSDIFYDKEKRQLHLNYVYKSKTYTVPAKRYKEYIAVLERARDDSSYSIQYRAGETSSTSGVPTAENWLLDNGWIIAITIYGFLIFLGIVLWTLADKNNITDVDTLYYPVSVPKFLFMWIMTLGMYGVYWFYKNYTFIKWRDGTSIMPMARGIFNLLWYYSIYKDLTLHKINNSVKATIPPRYVGVILAILFLATSLLSNREEYILLSFLFSGFLMIPMVNYIYHINEKDSVDSRYNSKLAFRHVVMTLIFLPLLLILIGSDTGLTASDSVISGDKLYNHDMKYMERKGVIKPGDKIAYFYSDAFVFIREDGNGYTERHVFSYWKEDGQLKVETASFNDIKDISITSGKSDSDDTVINIVRIDGTDFLLYVAQTGKKDKVFGRELKRRWQQVK